MTAPAVERLRRHASAFARRRAEALALAVVVAVAAGLRFVTVDAQSYWLDEAYSADMLARGLRATLDDLRETEAAPPLYYVLAWAWTRVAGTGEIGLRSFSALAGTLVVPVVYLAGRELVSRRVGLGAAVLAAVSPVLVWYSQEARAYSLLTLLAALSFLFFVRAYRRSSWLDAGLWALTSALAVATHYFAAYLVLAELVALLLAHRADRRVLAAGAAVIATGLALAPLAYLQVGERRTRWIGAVELDFRVQTAALRLLLPSFAPWWAGATGAPGELPAYWPAAIVLLAAASLALFTLARGRERAGRVGLGVGLAAVAAPLLVSLGARRTGGGLDLFLDRNVLAAWVPLNVALAAGLLVRRMAPAGAVTIAVLAAGSLVVVARTSTEPGLQRDDWRGLVAATGLGHGVVAVEPWYMERPLRQYAPQLRPLHTDSVRARRVTAVIRTRRRGTQLAGPDALVAVDRDGFQNFELVVLESPEPLELAPGSLRTGAGSPLLLLAPQGEYASSP